MARNKPVSLLSLYFSKHKKKGTNTGDDNSLSVLSLSLSNRSTMDTDTVSNRVVLRGLFVLKLSWCLRR